MDSEHHLKYVMRSVNISLLLAVSMYLEKKLILTKLILTKLKLILYISQATPQ